MVGRKMTINPTYRLPGDENTEIYFSIIENSHGNLLKLGLCEIPQPDDPGYMISVYLDKPRVERLLAALGKGIERL